MTGYGFEDAVRDRDEAYRLLHAAQAKLDNLAKILDRDVIDEWDAAGQAAQAWSALHA